MKTTRFLVALLFLTLGTLATLPGSPHQNVGTTEGVLVVQVAGGGQGAARRLTVVGLGFAAGMNQVVAYLPENSPDTVVLANPAGARWDATVTFRDPSGLVLLDVPGLSVDPYAFAQDFPGPVRRVWAATRNPSNGALTLREGTVEPRDTSSTNRSGILRHDAVVNGEFNLGAPLLNRCGEVVGVVPDTPNAAVPVPRILEVFGPQGLEATRSLQPCLTAEERRRAELQDSLEALRAKLDSVVNDTLPGPTDTLVVQDGALRDSLNSRIEELQDSIDNLPSPRRLGQVDPAPPPTIMWILIGISAVALLGLSFWLLSMRSSTSPAAPPVMVDPADPPPLPPRQELPPPREPTVSLKGRDPRGNHFSLEIPSDAMRSEHGVVVGRSPTESDVVLDQPEVSRRHFRLYLDGDQLFVEDLQSTNGTWVGTARLTPGVRAKLRRGDTLQVGSVTLQANIRS